MGFIFIYWVLGFYFVTKKNRQDKISCLFDELKIEITFYLHRFLW